MWDGDTGQPVPFRSVISSSTRPTRLAVTPVGPSLMSVLHISLYGINGYIALLSSSFLSRHPRREANLAPPVSINQWSITRNPLDIRLGFHVRG